MERGSSPRVLMVCTANICRSPMGEALLRHRASEAGLVVEVTSAGFLFDDEPAAPETVAAMAEMGLDISAHRSQKVTSELVESSDLVVTMERNHARLLVVDNPDAAGRIHTIGSVVEGLAAVSGASLRERAERLGEGRLAVDLLGRGPDEVDDPHGRPRRFHRRTARRLDELVGRLVEQIAVPPRPCSG